MFEKEAEEYANNHTHYEVGKREDGTEYAKKISDVTIQQAFLDGLKASRPQWHDLRKDPTDLPKEQKEYWCKVFLYESEETFNAFLWYDLKTKSFMFEEDIEEGLSDPFNVKEWCEIPTFDKE